MKTPKVSVLVPTYNYARYLPEAIESILDQDYPNFEVLVVDDCSSDNTAEVLQRYTKDPRFRFKINSPNLGMVANWNHCMEIADGELLKFVFGDDRLWQRDAISRMVRASLENPSATLIASARTIIDETSQVTEVWDHLGKPGLKNGIDVIVDCFVMTQNLIGEPSAVLFRKQDAARGFDPRYRQIVDLEFWMHLLEKGDLVYLADPLCAFRIHGSQQTAVNRVNKVGEREQLLLLAEYHEKPHIRERCGRLMVFKNIYRLRRNRGAAPASEIEERLMQTLGANWYRLYWIRHRLLRPVENFLHSFNKRVGRQKVLRAQAAQSISPTTSPRLPQ